MIRRLLPVVAVCATLSACGAGTQQDNTQVRTASGQALFSRACGACHTLSGHEDARHQGGDLRAFRASQAQLYQLAAEMPVRRPLSRTQLDTVVRFVMSVERGRSLGGG